MASYQEVSIDGQHYESIVAAFDGSVNGDPRDGIYFADGKPWGPPSVTSRRRDIVKVQFPMLDFMGTKDRGARERRIFITLIVIGAAARTAVEDLLDELKKIERYTVQIPDAPEREGCKLIDDPQTHEIALGSKTCIMVPCVFEQLSDTN